MLNREDGEKGSKGRSERGKGQKGRAKIKAPDGRVAAEENEMRSTDYTEALEKKIVYQRIM